MNKHLSDEQLARGFVGELTLAERQHVRECEDCSLELERFRDAVTSFRSAIRERIDLRIASRSPDALTAVRRPLVVGGANRKLALATAAAILLGLFPYLASEKLSQGTVENESTASANALMDAVNLHLARPVPEPMEPMFFWIPQDNSKIESGGVQ